MGLALELIQAPVTSYGSIKTLTTDDIVWIRSRYRLGRSATFILSTSTVHARLSIQAGDDLVLWAESETSDY